MRKITIESISAFNNSTTFSKGNTTVKAEKGNVKLLLFNNKIAERQGGNLYVSNGGHPLTSTTKERLNGLNGVKVYTSKGIDYLNGKEWDGSVTKIK